jgi:uncharacterized cupin superfamily protein
METTRQPGQEAPNLKQIVPTNSQVRYRMPTIIRNPLDVAPLIGTRYPSPYDQPCLTRQKRALGNLAGLHNFGINYTVLPPGSWSSQRHWHRVQDEFIIVMSGSLTLVTNEGETELSEGACVGFPAGEQNGHHLINRSDQDAAYIEIGDRLPGDSGEYPDIDMQFHFENGKGMFTRKDGSTF